MSEEEFFKREFENCGDVDREIEELENNEPAVGTIDHNNWEEKMNFLFEKYNKLSKFKAYRKIK